MNKFFTEIYDIDNYLLKFLSLNSLIKLMAVNKYAYDIVYRSLIYQQISELKMVNTENRLEYVVCNNYLKIIKLYNRDKKLDIVGTVYLASKYGQLKILKYLVSI